MAEKLIETPNDIAFLKAIARTGIATYEMARKFISEKRIYKLLKHGYITKEAYFIYGRYIDIYTLTDRIKERMRQEFLINPYKANKNQLEHDYYLAKVYVSLKPEERETWLTETALQEKYHGLKTTDAMFTSNGKKVAVEIVTDYYSDTDIEVKKDFIKNFCDDYIMFHTHKDIKYEI
ncbi:MAG: hypothetical protein H0Z24_03240 [Thermosipho sp. (in: Bacteria)]|nr:hypothetical protein [Thermosipho sp. (in: thermotogales)]